MHSIDRDAWPTVCNAAYCVQCGGMPPPFISPTAVMVVAHQNKTGNSFSLLLKCFPYLLPPIAKGSWTVKKVLAWSLLGAISQLMLHALLAVVAIALTVEPIL